MQTTQKPHSSSDSYTIRIASSDTGVTSNQLRNEECTFVEFNTRFSKVPPVGPKDGSYILRGPLRDGCTTRSDANIEYSSLIVLDGDKQCSPETGEVSEGAPDPKATHEALKRLGIAHILHTTHSHQQHKKSNKFRVLIPIVPSPTELVQPYVEHMCELLAKGGIPLHNVRENSAISQPWYLPRRANADQPYQHYYYGEAPPLDLTAELRALQEQSVEIDRIDADVVSKPPRAADSMPARYNSRHGSMSQMQETLISHGYNYVSPVIINGASARRFCCPESTTGRPGVVLFQCSDGTVRVYSHHGSDPLNEDGTDQRAKDAFDVYRILEHGGSASAATRAFMAELDPRPVIEHAPGESHEQLAIICEGLCKLDPNPVFQRGGNLVRIAHAPERSVEDGIEVPVGTASIHPYKKTTLSLELSRHFQFGYYNNDKKWIPTEPYGNLVGTLLDAFGYWGDIPSLRGISESPIFRDDGTLHSKPGYDPSTQLYVEGRVPPIDLPENVTRADALGALEIAFSPFREFPFVDLELGRSCVLAYLLTLLVRPLIPTAPMFIFSATTPGTGKGLLVEVANTLVRGRDAAIMPPVRGKESQEEMRKRLTSVIAHGMSSLNIDNCTQPLGGDALNALLTTTEWTDRQLGSNRIIKMPVCVTLAATGNNLGVRGDMVRRTILTQLDAQVERPEQRVFEERDLVGATRRRRSERLRAIFMILKGYQQSGCTDFQDDRLGRFEEWSERVCHPIQWLGLPNPTDSQALLRQEDPEFEALRSLLVAWHGAHNSAWIGTKDLIPEYSFGFQSDPLQGSLGQALIEVAGSRDRVDSKRLGWYLKRNLGRVAGGFRLERKDKGDLAGNHGHQYRVVPVDQSPASTPTQNDG